MGKRPGMTDDDTEITDGPDPEAHTEIHELVAEDALAAAGAEAERTTGFEPLPDPAIDALRDTAFTVVWRGYDPHAVDAYVEAVERCIARFDEHRSPSEAVRRALDRVGERTAAILREAERSAQETTTASRAKADDRLQRAERESEELWAEAQARVRSLDEDVERLWQERERLIDATRELAASLRGIADDAEARFPPEPGGTGEPGGPGGGGSAARAASRNGGRAAAAAPAPIDDPLEEPIDPDPED